MTRQKNWFNTWCASTGNLLLYYFKHFAIGAYLLLVIAMFVGFVRIENLATENKNRIADIQESRLLSCRSTYESIRQVFKPFFPPKAHRTKKQQADLDKFNRTIDQKIRECRKQVTPPPITTTK